MEMAACPPTTTEAVERVGHSTSASLDSAPQLAWPCILYPRHAVVSRRLPWAVSVSVSSSSSSSSFAIRYPLRLCIHTLPFLIGQDGCAGLTTRCLVADDSSLHLACTTLCELASTSSYRLPPSNKEELTRPCLATSSSKHIIFQPQDKRLAPIFYSSCLRLGGFHGHVPQAQPPQLRREYER